MGSNDSGLKQSPWDNPPVPTPEATSGDQGVGGGLEAGPGGNGLTSIPWKEAPVPVPSNLDAVGGPFGDTSRFSQLDGSTHEGESLQGDITFPPSNTIDKR